MSASSIWAARSAATPSSWRTGVLLGVLLERLGPAARVEAVDLAPRMIARASVKHPDARVRFHVAGAARLPLPDASVDRAVCFSVWPHLHDPDAVIAELERVLRPGGTVHVWHVDGRETIDAIHRGAGEAVGDDRLEPADALAGRFRRRGFTVTEAVDTADTYRVTAVSSAPEAS